MTIAIGYHCHNGVVLAADTMVIIGPDVYEGTKLDARWKKYGSFAFVNSSNDGQATATLIEDIFDGIERAAACVNYKDLGAIVRRSMTDWRRGFGARRPPETQLILGAKLKGQTPKLFSCEPPNTFLEKDDYFAVGAGASVTDPIYHTLFGNNGGDHTNAQEILRRISYLIYRAKKDSWMCGKRTEAAVVHRDHVEPTLVNDRDLAHAEYVSAGLDLLLSAAAMYALGSSDSTLDANANELADILKEGNVLHQTVFHDRYGDEINI